MKETEVKTALIVVDAINSFFPGGELPVTDGDKVVEPLNVAIRYGLEKGWLLLATNEDHPEDTVHFQKWPVHGVHGTRGAEFHPDLLAEHLAVFYKGRSKEDDGYSGFEGQNDNGELLVDVLKKSRITRVLIGGLATDYCVKETALSARGKEHNEDDEDYEDYVFETYVLLDAIKAVNINPGDEGRAIDIMRDSGVKFTQTIYLEMLG